MLVVGPLHAEAWRALSRISAPLVRARQIARWEETGLGLELLPQYRHAARDTGATDADGNPVWRRELLYQHEFDLHTAAMELVKAGALRVERMPNGDWVYPNEERWNALQWNEGW